jgi:hypothetical protein
MMLITNCYRHHAALGVQNFLRPLMPLYRQLMTTLMLALDYYLFLRGVLRIAEPRRVMSWIRSCKSA